MVSRMLILIDTSHEVVESYNWWMTFSLWVSSLFGYNAIKIYSLVSINKNLNFKLHDML